MKKLHRIDIHKRKMQQNQFKKSTSLQNGILNDQIKLESNINIHLSQNINQLTTIFLFLFSLNNFIFILSQQGEPDKLLAFCLQSLQLSMKKQRKIADLSNNATFTTQFKLKSTQPLKEERHKKFTTTFSHFKQHLLQEESKNRESKEFSRQKKPILQQLKFIVNNKEDDFKAPRSLSKRSNGKSHMEDDKRKLQKLNNQIFEQFYQQIKVDKQRKKSTAYMWDMVTQRKFKQKSIQNAVKQKIEKTALQKFKDAISNENEEAQNKINQKNAQALYMLLKTGRSRNLKNKFEHSDEGEEEQRKPKRVPTQSNERKQQREIFSVFANQDVKEKKNSGQKVENNRPPSAKRTITDIKQKIQDKKVQEIPKVLEQKKNRKESFQLKNRVNIKEQIQIKQKQKPSNIDIILKNQTFQSNEQFSQSQQKSQSIKKINQLIIKRQNSTKIVQKVEKVEKNQKVERNQAKIVEKDWQKKQSIKQTVKTAQSKKQIKNIPIQSNKKDVQQKPKKPQLQKPPKQQKNKRQLFADIPSGVVIDTVERKKSQQVTKKIQNRKQSSGSINIQDNNIQKILTTKYLQSQHNIVNKAPTLAPPPKLSNNNIPSKQNIAKKAYNVPQVNEDELQVVQWNGKPKAQIKPQQKNKLQAQVKKQQIQNKQPQPKNKLQKQIEQQKQQNKQNEKKLNQQQNFSEQDSLDQILDQLAFYTQRMEDIGQYRVNSKDLYNDKWIDKELIKSYKVCSYYMAHQFLYLTQILLQLIQGQQINRDYYTISVQQLIELQKEDILSNEVDNLTRNVQESKKLLKKCYEDCKPFLQSREQILCLDGHTNYYKQCCSMLVKQFRKMLELLTNKPNSTQIQKRCCYLIEMFCVLKMFNSQNLKEFEQVQEITDCKNHIQTYKHLLIGN